jgi:hypothetical protein
MADDKAAQISAATILNTNQTMSMPASQVMGKWATSRSNTDQQMILEMAQEYFSTSEIELLQKLLGKPAMTFDANEAQVLLSRGDQNMLMGLTAHPGEQANAGYLQFYDFCLTVDTVKNIMRGMYAHLNSKVINRDMLRNFESMIQYPDMVPPEIRKELSALQTGDATDHFKSDYYSLTNDKYFDETEGKILTKTGYMRAYDEAYQLNSPLCRSLQALAQGLFTVYTVNAYPLFAGVSAPQYWPETDKNPSKWKLPWVDTRVQPLVEQTWINSFSNDKLNYIFDAEGKITTTMNVGADSPANVVQLLQPKRNGIEYYNVNWSAYSKKPFQTQPPSLFGDGPPKEHAIEKAGGAIPKYLSWLNKETTGSDAMSETAWFPRGGGATAEIKPSMLKERFQYMTHHPLSSAAAYSNKWSTYSCNCSVL